MAFALKSHYLCNDNAETSTVLDNLSFNNADFYLEGAPSNTNLASAAIGKINQAFNLTYQNLIYANTYNLPAQCSVAMWVRRDSASGAVQEALFYKSSPSFGIFTLYYDASADLWALFCWNGTGTEFTQYTYPSSTIPADGNWHHIIAIYNGSGASNQKWKLYIDTVLKTPTVYADYGGTPYANNGAWTFIGADTYQYGINGEIDDIRLYEGVIDNLEISKIWNNGNGTESEEILVAGPFPTFFRI
jgi:hypothetical protein